jgi:hypothetical protein
MAEIVGSLFGITPDMYERQQRQSAMNEGAAFARMAPEDRAIAGIYSAGAGLGRTAGGLLGVEDPQMKLISARQQIMSQTDQSNPQSLANAANQLNAIGDTQGAMALMDFARKAQSEMALVGQRRAAETASLAQAAKTNLTIRQEEELRAKLSQLGPNATEDQVIGVLTQYGPPEKVLAALTTAQSRKESTQARTEANQAANQARIDAAKVAADAALERAKVAADARIEAARERGATQMQIAQLQADSKREIAQLQADSKREIAQLVAALKGPSAAVLKAQEKAEKVAEGQLALSDTLSTAETLVKDLAKMGGITSTSKSPLANLVTSLQTGTVGQIAGQKFGTKEQAKRDELKSIRLQLLNAVKEATGMSAQQLNSNVELKTYLDSLGSEGMTAEANLAILDNLSRRYLKGEAAQPAKNKSDPLGIR